MAASSADHDPRIRATSDSLETNETLVMTPVISAKTHNATHNHFIERWVTTDEWVVLHQARIPRHLDINLRVMLRLFQSSPNHVDDVRMAQEPLEALGPGLAGERGPEVAEAHGEGVGHPEADHLELRALWASSLASGWHQRIVYGPYTEIKPPQETGRGREVRTLTHPASTAMMSPTTPTRGAYLVDPTKGRTMLIIGSRCSNCGARPSYCSVDTGVAYCSSCAAEICAYVVLRPVEGVQRSPEIPLRVVS